MRSLADAKTTRHLTVVRAQADGTGPAARRRSGVAVRGRRAVVVAGAYLVLGLRLLGQHFTAYVWTTDVPDALRRPGPRPV